MTYNPIYQFEFDSLKDGTVQHYKGVIEKKRYTGTVSNVTAAGSPVTQQWQDDDPRSVIKGGNLTVNLINDGSLPLSNFFSVTDDTFRIKYYWGDQLLFTGYLVQSDCAEIQIDITHEIQLSFTDGLGLLKDIPFDQANKLCGDKRELNVAFATGGKVLILNTPTTGGNVGDYILVDGDTQIDGVYEILTMAVVTGVTYFGLNVQEDFPPLGMGAPCDFVITTPMNLNDRVQLKEIIKVCLQNTGLNLTTSVFGNLVVDGGSTGRMLDDVYISCNTFLNGSRWDSCNEVLNKILGRLYFSLFQSYGVWNLVRMDELRSNDNDIPSYGYDYDFSYTGAGGILQLFNYGDGTDIETGLLSSLLRPYKFVNNKMDYIVPDLLLNADLQSTGELLSTYTSGGYTYYEYEMNYWEDGFSATDRFIRVKKDSLGNEVERYAVIVNGLSIRSTAIESNVGDVVKFSFSFRSSNSQPGTVNLNFYLRIWNGTSYLNVNNVGLWVSPAAFQYTVSPGDNTNVWHDVEITSLATPYTGLIYCYLSAVTASTTDESQFKNLRFEIITSINETTKIIGHTHTDTQPPAIKNISDTDITIDDSPRNAIKGTLFLNTFTSLVRDRTSEWARRGITETKRLGEITTFEQLFYRRKARMKLEGNLLNLVQDGVYRFSGECQFAVYDPPLEYAIKMNGLPAGILTAGVQFTISGSSSNDGTFTVVGPSASLSGGVEVVEVVLPETSDCTLSITGFPVHLSLLNVIKYANEPDLNFIFGMLNIKFRDNQANGTMWEQWEDGETDADLLQKYNFKYLYDNK